MREEEVRKMLSFSLDPQRRREAEELSLKIDGGKEEIISLIKGLETKELQEISGVFLRVSLRKSQEMNEVLAEEIFHLLVKRSLFCSKRCFALLCESIRTISMHLSAEKIQFVAENIEEEPSEASLRALSIFKIYFSKYTTESKSNQLYLDILSSVAIIGEKLLGIIRKLGEKKDSEVFVCCYEIFYCLIFQDLPEIFEEHLDEILLILMQGTDLGKDAEVHLMVQILTLVISRFNDAVNNPLIFGEHGVLLIREIENIPESIHSSILRYVSSLFHLPDMRTAFRENFIVVTDILMKRPFFNEEEEDLECVRSFFTPDLLLEREIISSILCSEGILEVSLNYSMNLLNSIQVVNEAHREVGNILYFSMVLLRDNKPVPNELVTRLLSFSYSALMQRKEEELLLSASGFLSVLAEKRLFMNRDLINLIVEILSEKNISIRASYLLCKLLKTLSDLEEHRTLEVDDKKIRKICTLLQEVPPNEFIASGIFSLLLLSKCNTSEFVEIACNYLRKRIGESANLWEEKALWDIVFLGVFKGDAPSILLAYSLAMDSLMYDATEWFPFSLQILSSIVIFSQDKSYLETLESICNNKELWNIDDLKESLAYCVCALSHRLLPEQSKKYILLGFSLLEEQYKYVITRYANRNSLLFLLSSNESLSPLEYFIFFKTHQNSSSVPDAAIDSLLRSPVILEEDTSFYLTILPKIEAIIQSDQKKVKIKQIISKLSERKQKKKENPRLLSLINTLFSYLH
ncbi:hypothetical protein NEFER03_0333 [Nematocida sp. LUAm3]|nr:hypothetical protein NEFER03_0333 [Nematocida sp. LUAm3]KAI5173785.1 hypothetical protein NEFER02_0301 [Nematocida sp. LUAm2]KAI5177008.1 hypothetical protein NEFER01_0333 [Nematocida sp. LUAm1]